MYSENSVTIFPTLTATNYLLGFIGNSIGVIRGEKLNGHNYFSWPQFIKMALEGHHEFGYPIAEMPRPRPKDPQERKWKEEDSLLRSVLLNNMEPQSGKSVPVCEHCKKPCHTKDGCWKLHGRPPNENRGDLGTLLGAIAQLGPEFGKDDCPTQ
ncbi:UBN2_3 domain-containing protein [Cucumis melo var. makuwa]|uniref:UBN2_3 domain-containing protein n=1 Tax=Cucumis melo var. makuwa TaxID=1194695 RepID=A0A5A7TMX6_CUCMM|nr:UBN2_3 domain-containing protein [Cucumis melo var. makuwa]